MCRGLEPGTHLVRELRLGGFTEQAQETERDLAGLGLQRVDEPPGLESVGCQALDVAQQLPWGDAQRTRYRLEGGEAHVPRARLDGLQVVRAQPRPFRQLREGQADGSPPRSHHPAEIRLHTSTSRMPSPDQTIDRMHTA